MLARAKSRAKSRARRRARARVRGLWTDGNVELGTHETAVAAAVAYARYAEELGDANDADRPVAHGQEEGAATEATTEASTDAVDAVDGK